MLSRRTGSSTNSLGLILGLTVSLVIVIPILLLIIWHWRLRSAHSRSRSKRTPRGLTFLRARSEKDSALNSASSYASTFGFPKKNSDNTSADLEDPSFRFPTPLEKPLPLAALPPLPSQVGEFTAYRVYIDMDKSPLPSTQDSPVSYNVKNDPEGWRSSYYAETLPASRPPSYYCTPSCTHSRSPLSGSLRSGLLSWTHSANSGTRPISQTIDDTVSTDIDSLYVESHSGGDWHAPSSDKNLRIMSIAPQIPSIYLGVPFGAFAKLEVELEEGVVEGEIIGESTSPECVQGEAQTINTIHPSCRRPPPMAIATCIKHLEKAVVKNKRTIPAGWF